MEAFISQKKLLMFCGIFVNNFIHEVQTSQLIMFLPKMMPISTRKPLHSSPVKVIFYFYFCFYNICTFPLVVDYYFNHSRGYFPILLAMYCRTTYNDASAWLVKEGRFLLRPDFEPESQILHAGVLSFHHPDMWTESC